MITIGYSTRKTNPQYQEYLKKSCGLKNVEVIEIVNDGLYSLSEAYNKILDQATHDKIVFCHDDIEFDTNSWGYKLIKNFDKNQEYGIIGVAGTKYLPESAKWWEIPHTMYGIVNHKNQGKKWASTYSKEIGNKVEEVVLIDGLFIAVDKNKIKKRFDETVSGFHFYDVTFSIQNYLEGVKIGIITNIRLTHLSIGQTNHKWEENRSIFVEKYKDVLPLNITNQGVCETFVFCHDQDIILEYEKSEKFKNFEKYRYVFLGNRPTDKIENLENIIIARNLEHNIEEYPNINVYTGWYALWKNNLITTPYINLFEYDVITHKNIEQVQSKIMYDEHTLMGYLPLSVSNYHFIEHKEWVEVIFEAIKKVYKIDLEKILKQFIEKNPNALWTTTSNCTMKTSFFEKYMDWFHQLFDHIKDTKTAGHNHERSITFFSIFSKEPVVILQGLLKHYQMNSHGTQGHQVDYEKSMKELINN